MNHHNQAEPALVLYLKKNTTLLRSWVLVHVLALELPQLSHSQADDAAFSRCVSFTPVRYNATLLLDGSGQLSPGTQHAWRSRWPAAIAALLAHLFMAVCELSAAVEQFPSPHALITFPGWLYPVAKSTSFKKVIRTITSLDATAPRHLGRKH